MHDILLALFYALIFFIAVATLFSFGGDRYP